MPYVKAMTLMFLSLFLLIGCGNKNKVALYNQHPEKLFADAMECGRLSEKEILNNSRCLAIAHYEKPFCERELKLSGSIMTPGGIVSNCDDPSYLMARPLIEARMQAALENKPDPITEYLKNHPNE